MEGWRDEIGGWKYQRVEGRRDGGVNGWRGGEMERWRDGKIEI